MRGTPPYAFIWPYALAFWIVYVWAFLPEFGVIMRANRDSKRRERSQDAGSMNVIMLGGWIGMFMAFAVAWNRKFIFGEPERVILFWAGLALLVAGSLLRRHCFRMLGQYFTGNVVVRADHVVIDRGAYRFVRHPSYTAGMMMFTAIGLSLGSWLSTLVAAGSAVAVYIYRVRVEERALASTIGAPYLEFMKTRKRFIPYVI